jgi:hypothetical protein
MRWLALAVAVALAPAGAAPVYDLRWTSFARIGHFEEGEVRTTSGQLDGRAVASLSPARESPAVLRLEFEGPEGRGGGFVGLAGPMAFEFPTGIAVGTPPAVPHLSGGTFEFVGDRAHPQGFVVSYIEGFICRAQPRACGGVVMWERRFEGRATRR